MAGTTQLAPVLRRTLPFLTVALIAAIAYDAWVFYSRWSSSRHADQVRQQREAAEARKTLDALGGGGLKILSFYATPGAIRVGERTTLCYSITGANQLRIEPPVAELRPALSYCFPVSPAKDTEYKLTAADASGHNVTSTVPVRVTR